MNASQSIAEKVRLTTERKTDYAVAKALGITQSNLKQVLLGKRTLGNESCFRAAKLLRVTAGELIADVEAERSKTPEKRAFWEKQLPRYLPVVAYLGIATGVTFITEKGALVAEVVRHAIHCAQYASRRARMRTVLMFPRVCRL
ncbi:MAG TPA: hypothetical protein VK652_01440 [Steroidobacteraceae bacterium]|nr:hypothetical protein [Steroidobacteraceae bacterium]